MEPIAWLQQLASPGMDAFFVAVTLAGDPEFYILALPVVFWSAVPAFALRLCLVVLAGGWAADSLKQWLQLPRPDMAVWRAFHDGDLGYGFPSGHAVGSVVFWGYIAWYLRRAWLFVAAGLAVALIGLSRVYLGVHWVADVVGGVLVALAVMVAVLWTEPRVTPRIVRMSGTLALPLVLAASVALALLSPGKLGVQIAGAAGGFGVGYLALRRWAPDFHAGIGPVQMVVRVALGLAVLLAIRLGVREALPDVLAAHYLRYLLMGLWITLGPPLLVRGRGDGPLPRPAGTVPP